MYGKLLGAGVVYGLGFTLIKSLFPSPVLLLFAGGPSSEGDLTVLSSVYIASGLIAGIVGGPLFGLLVLRSRGSGGSSASVGRFSASYTAGADLWRSLVLSFGFAMLIGFISGLLTMAAYYFEVLPPGGVLDPLTLIRSSNFSPGYPLLVAWTFARDLLPAMLAGLMLAPFGGGLLYRIYASQRPKSDATGGNRRFEEF